MKKGNRKRRSFLEVFKAEVPDLKFGPLLELLYSKKLIKPRERRRFRTRIFFNKGQAK